MANFEEYVDILNNNGASTGRTCLKSVAHEKGYYHPTVHVWFYTKDGKILLQKRGANKQTFPSLWDVSVAGHVHAGELIMDAVLREVKEEIGLHIALKELKKIGINKSTITHNNGVKDFEFQHIFLVKLLVPIERLTIQDEEVEDIRLFSLDEIESGINNPNASYKLVPSDKNYYDFVLKHISEELQ